MDIDHILLTGEQLAGLFPHALVSGEEKRAPANADYEENRAPKYLGGNLKKVSLLMESGEYTGIPEADLLFITKMLEACKMNLGDVAIVNMKRIPQVQELKKFLQSRTMILFGLEPGAIRLPFHIPPFKIQEYDGCRFLFAPTLEKLKRPTEEGKILKSKLWVCLRSLFSV